MTDEEAAKTGAEYLHDLWVVLAPARSDGQHGRFTVLIPAYIAIGRLLAERDELEESVSEMISNNAFCHKTLASTKAALAAAEAELAEARELLDASWDGVMWSSVDVEMNDLAVRVKAWLAKHKGGGNDG